MELFSEYAVTISGVLVAVMVVYVLFKLVKLIEKMSSSLPDDAKQAGLGTEGFPRVVKCAQCGRGLKIEKAGAYVCKCGAKFKVTGG